MKPAATISKKTTRSELIDRVPKYLFPFVLIVFQLVMRSAAGDKSFLFVGPALASAGAALAISLTSFRSSRVIIDIPDEIQRVIDQSDFLIEPKNAHRYRVCCFLIATAMTFAWAFAVIFSLQVNPVVVSVDGVVVQVQFLLGLVCYIISLLLSEYKEFFL